MFGFDRSTTLTAGRLTTGGFGAAGAAVSAAGLLIGPRAIASIAVLTLKNLLFILVSCLKIKGATQPVFAGGV
jgi:hypothetical protein